MATIQTRDTAGNLVEQAAPDSQVQQLGGVPVVSPAGAASQGANPNVAKMAGTPAAQQLQVQPTKLADQIPKAGTEASRTSATDDEQAATSKADRLASLGSLNTRVEGLIKAQFNRAGANQVAGPSVNQAQLASLNLPAADLATAQQLLTTYTSAPDQQGKVDAEAAFNNFLKAKGVATNQPITTYIQQTVDAGHLAASAAATPESLTLSTLGMTPEDQKAAESLLGPNWATSTVAQLQQAVQGEQASTFNRVGALRAQLAALPPGSIQAQEVQRQLADLGSVGVERQEADFKGFADQIAKADEVQWGGQTRKLTDLLGDANVTKMVSDYLAGNITDDVKGLQTASPDFLKWVDANKAHLTELVAGMNQAEHAYSTQQAAYSALKGGLSDNLMKAVVPDWDPTAAHTKADIDAATAKLAASGVHQLASSNPEIIAALEKLPADQQAKLAGESADDLKASFNAGSTLTATPEVAQILGVTPSPFVDAATAKLVARVLPVVTAVKAAPGGDVALQDHMIRDYIKGGQITADNAASIMGHYAEAHQRSTEEMQAASALAGLGKGSNVDDVLTKLYGVTAQQVNEGFKETFQEHRADPSNPQVNAKVAEYKKLFGLDADAGYHEFTNADSELLVDAARKRLSNAPDLMSLLNNPSQDTGVPTQAERNLILGGGRAQAGTLQDAVRRALDDHGQLTVEDVNAMSPDQQAQLAKQSPTWLAQVGMPDMTGARRDAAATKAGFLDYKDVTGAARQWLVPGASPDIVQRFINVWQSLKDFDPAEADDLRAKINATQNATGAKASAAKAAAQVADDASKFAMDPNAPAQTGIQAGLTKAGENREDAIKRYMSAFPNATRSQAERAVDNPNYSE